MFLVFYRVLEWISTVCRGFQPFPALLSQLGKTGKCYPDDIDIHTLLPTFLIVIFNHFISYNPGHVQRCLVFASSRASFTMSNPYNLRPRRAGEQRYTDPESDIEKETDTIAEDNVSSGDPEWNSRVSANNSVEIDSTDARGSSSHVPAPAPPLLRAVTALRRTPSFPPTYLSNRSLDPNITRLYFERAALLQSGLQQPIMNNTDPHNNPLPRALRRVASAPALQDADGRARQRFEMGLSSESENGDSSQSASPLDDDQVLYNTRFLRPTHVPTCLNVEADDGHRMPSEGKPSAEDASYQESNKENYVHPALRAQAKSPPQDQSRPASLPRIQVEEAPSSQEVAEEPAPVPHELSSRNVLPEFGYGYGYGAPNPGNPDIADPPDLGDDEPHFFRDALAEIEARDAAEANYEESSLLREILETVAAMPGWHEVLGTGSNEDQETEQDDSWMEEYFDFEKYYKE